LGIVFVDIDNCSFVAHNDYYLVDLRELN
jgi:hypothetical protein